MSFDAVCRTAKDLYHIPTSACISLTYVDEENDEILVSSGAEFVEFLRISDKTGATRIGFLKFGVVVEEPKAGPATSPVHEGVTCDGCGTSPITGIRFKCAVRDDFDLCACCEAKEVPSHPMLKLYSPDAGARVRYRSVGGGRCGRFQSQPSVNGRWGGGCPRRRFGLGEVANAVAEVAAVFTDELEEQAISASALKEAGSADFPRSEAAHASDAVHDRVSCDGCGMKPIVGPRFKCTVRDNFDLCSGCEAKVQQPYPMLKICTPDIDIRVKGWTGPQPRSFPNRTGKCWGRGIPVPAQPEHLNRRSGVPATAAPTAPVAVSAPVAAMEDVDRLILEDVMRMSEMDSSSQALAVAKNEEVSRQTSEIVSEPAVAISATAVEQPVQKSAFNQGALRGYALKPMARFVGDVTVPDFSVLPPSTDFIKIWLVRNDGPCEWPPGVQLVTAGGDPMCSATMVVPVESIPVGAETRVSVTLRTPSAAGRYVSYFKLQAPDGTIFGQKLWADVRVQIPAGGSAAPGAFTSPAFLTAPKQSLGSASHPPAAPIPTVKAVPLVVKFGIPTAEAAPIIPAPIIPVPESPMPEVEASISDADEQWQRERVVLEQEWKVELDALRAMGFHETRQNVGLLKAHVQRSYNRYPQLHGQPFNDALSTILDALLR